MLLTLDLSGAIVGGALAGVRRLSPRVGSAAMALVAVAAERDYHVMAFSSQFCSSMVS